VLLRLPTPNNEPFVALGEGTIAGTLAIFLGTHMKMKTYNLEKVAVLREALMEDLLLYYSGLRVKGEYYENFVSLIARHMPLVDRSIIFESLLTYLDIDLTDTVLKQLAWRMAGNQPRLRKRIPVPPWTGCTGPEWVPMQVIDWSFVPGIGKRQQGGFYYQLRTLAGTPCPLRVQQLWTKEYVKASKFSDLFGFTRSFQRGNRPFFPFKDGSELMGLRFYGLIEPKECIEGQPGFKQIMVPASLKSYNREIMAARMKIDPPCPKGYRWDCYLCPIGYNECRAGCHVNTYVVKPCTRCGNTKAGFDETKSKDVCVLCSRELS
jgi:hypothetical protein